MITHTALAGLMLALVFLGYAIAAILLRRGDQRWMESARRAVQAASMLTSLALAFFLYLLVHQRVEYAAVYRVIRSGMSLAARVSALWGGQTGSLLLWTWLLGMVAFVAAHKAKKSDPLYRPWLLLFTLLPFASYLVLVIFFDNPFARWWLFSDGGTTAAVFSPSGAVALPRPDDGAGLNPLLRHPAMVIHPPLLYLGFISFTLPFAEAMAALMSGEATRDVMNSIRRGTLVAWFFLTLGLTLGSRWAYDVLGWGGYWGWDPVEIAGLLPWLTSSAVLHLMMRGTRHKGRTRLVLGGTLLTFCLVILGSFLTRSGLLTSVHAFAESTLSPALLAIFIASVAGSFGIWLRGRAAPRQSRGQTIVSFWGVVLDGSALVLILLLIVCLVGLAVPVGSEWLMDQAMIVGPAYYRQATGPLWLLLLALVAPTPLYPHSMRRGSQSLRSLVVATSLSVLVSAAVNGLLPLNLLETALLFMSVLYFLLLTEQILRRGKDCSGRRSDRSLRPHTARFAGIVLLHLGVFLFAWGVLGMERQQTIQGALAAGGHLEVGEYTVRLDEVVRNVPDEQRTLVVATVSLYEQAPDAVVRLARVFPALEQDLVYDQVRAIPGVYSRIDKDLYVLFTGWNPEIDVPASLRVMMNPLANFLWIGGLAMASGALVMMIPDVFERRSDQDEASNEAGQ